jgi:hypothetical protein
MWKSTPIPDPQKDFNKRELLLFKGNPVLPVLTKEAPVLDEGVQSFQRNSILPRSLLPYLESWVLAEVVQSFQMQSSPS